MRIFQNTHYLFIEKRRGAYLFSGLVLAAGIAAMVLNIASVGSWQRYGVDFTGGVLVQVRFEEGVGVDQLRSSLGGAQAPAITRFGEENEFVIRAQLAGEENVEAISNGIADQIASAGLGAFEIVRTESVGPKIGAELQQRAAGAILFSLLITLLYLAIRFEFRFGVAAVVATLHDIVVALGIMALFRIEISLTIIAALLTIVGYSLNDTIVVFDRIRENLNRKGGRKEDFVALVDRSINETLPRTVMTSATTLVVLVSLLLLGGPVIRDFALILSIGIVVGTYSSIFVASPVLVEIRARFGEGRSRDEGTAGKPARASASAS